MLQFYENQIFEDIYPIEVAKWCNNSQDTENKFYIDEIESIRSEVEENSADGKSTIITKTTRRFQIKKIPNASSDELKAYKRRERDNAIVAVLWLIERHQQELSLSLEPTLSHSEYIELLQYIQTLRNIPQQPNFPCIDLPQKPSFI